MKHCCEFYVKDTNLLLNRTHENIRNFILNEGLKNPLFKNIAFTIFECKNALLISFSYLSIVDPQHQESFNILNIRIFKNKVDRVAICGSKEKVFDLIFGLLNESVDKYERSKKLAFETIERDGSGYVNLILQTKEKLHKFLDEMVEKWK